jgi:hypothetical protein
MLRAAIACAIPSRPRPLVLPLLPRPLRPRTATALAHSIPLPLRFASAAAPLAATCPTPVLAAPRSRLALRLLRRAPVAAALPFSACPTTPRTPHWPLAPSTPLSTSSCPPSPSLPPLPLASRRRPRVPCAAPPLSLFPPARRRSALPLRLLPLQLRRCHPLVRLAALPSPPPPPPAPPLPASAVSFLRRALRSFCLSASLPAAPLSCCESSLVGLAVRVLYCLSVCLSV